MPVNNTLFAQTSDFKWASSIEEVNNYPTAPGVTIHFFDREKQVFYVKTTGQPTRAFKFEEIVQERPSEQPGVTLEQISALIDEKLENALKNRNQNRGKKPYKKQEQITNE